MKRICAPLATLGHPAFRIMIEKFGGCDEYYTEMINAASLLNNGQFENYYTNPQKIYTAGNPIDHLPYKIISVKLKLFKLNRCRRLPGAVIQHAVDTLYLIHNPTGYLAQHLPRKLCSFCSHEIRG